MLITLAFLFYILSYTLSEKFCLATYKHYNRYILIDFFPDSFSALLSFQQFPTYQANIYYILIGLFPDSLTVILSFRQLPTYQLCFYYPLIGFFPITALLFFRPGCPQTYQSCFYYSLIGRNPPIPSVSHTQRPISAYQLNIN